MMRQNDERKTAKNERQMDKVIYIPIYTLKNQHVEWGYNFIHYLLSIIGKWDKKKKFLHFTIPKQTSQIFCNFTIMQKIYLIIILNLYQYSIICSENMYKLWQMVKIILRNGLTKPTWRNWKIQILKCGIPFLWGRNASKYSTN